VPELSLEQIQDALGGARLVNAERISARLAEIRVSRISPLAQARAGAVAFFFSQQYQHDLMGADPSVLVTGDAFVEPLLAAPLPLISRRPILAVADPYLAMARLSGFFVEKATPGGVHPMAIVSEQAQLGKDVTLAPGAVVEAGAVLGDRVRVGVGAVIGARATVGADSEIFARVTLYPGVRLGERVRVHSGSVIGADGFGYAPRLQDGKPIEHVKIHHLGTVVLEDDVEIGANTCVDRGTFGETRVGRGAKIDNLVQIGHNTVVEEGAIICGCTATAGSSKIGRFAYIGGGSAITNQIQVGDHAQVAAYTLVAKDVPPGESVAGQPMRKFRDHFRIHAMLNKMLKDRTKGEA
jgi:UDP-3-O-[3-hydroxymyristoyl] glucosamine N-acyltransferase